MRRLDRYLLRELLIPLAYCTAGFLIFWISFDLLSDLDKFEKASLGMVGVLYYYVLKIPEFMVVAIPVALLLACLFALTQHERYHELTAMRAAGISLWRICLPYFLVGLILSLVVWDLNEVWAPKADDRAAALLSDNAHSAKGDWYRQLNVENRRARRIWMIEAFNLSTFAMRHPNVVWDLPDGTSRDLVARSARWEKDHWVFKDAVVFTAHRGPGAFWTPMEKESSLVMTNFWETPQQIKSVIKVQGLSRFRATKRPQLSIAEILNYQRLNPDLPPREQALLDTQLQARLAIPWTSLVVVLIAIPFGAAGGRRNVYVGVAASIFICFTYFVLQRFGLALGTGGYIPPWLAAWSPNGFFALAGLWLIRQTA